MAKRKKTIYTPAEFKQAFMRSSKGRVCKVTEKGEQLALRNWLLRQHPAAVGKGDLAGANLSKTQQSEHKTSTHKGFPDLMIYNPAAGFIGLALELKKTGVTVRTKQGRLRKSEHLTQQHKMLQILAGFGWCSSFACGLKQAKQIINLYFAGDAHGLRALCFPLLP